MLLNIQALRAIAALLVVLVHSKAVLEPAGYDASRLGFGLAGVDLFFVISGFIMVFMTAERKPDPAKFAINRVLRIVPLYWIVTLAVFAVAAAAPALVQATKPDIIELLKSLFFIPFTKSNGQMQPVVFVGWTLNYEMFFYALFALGLFLGRRGIAATLAAIVALVALHPFARSPVLAFYTDPILLEFGAGMAIGWAYPRLRGRGGLALVVAGFALIFAAPSLWPDYHRALIYGLPSVLIVAGAIMLETQGKTAGGLKLLGDASYSIYLTHFFATGAVRKVYAMFSPSLGLAILFIVGAFVASAILGVIVHRLIEKPATEAARWLTRRRSKRLAAAAW